MPVQEPMSPGQKQLLEAMAALAKTSLGGAPPVDWDRLDVGIEHKGRAITLPAEPEDMPTDKAIEALRRRLEDEAQEFIVHEHIEGYPLEAAVAFTKAMNKFYGWASPKTVMTFFGPRPPRMLTVRVGPKDTDVLQCPMGAFKLPGVSEDVNTLIDTDEPNDPKFIVHATIPKRERHLLIELANEARRFIRTESIYRGKPIRLRVNDQGVLDMVTPPEFMDVSDMNKGQLYFDDALQNQIDTNLLVPMEHTDECRRNNIPLKRGVLLYGKYGVGKTLLARLAARVAEQNSWTFILLDKIQGLKTALQFANRYAPAVVFAEDVDRIAEKRDDKVNDLINIVDGVLTKRSEIMTVLTTNFVDKLDRAMLRAGRLDAVIHITAPGPETVQRLMRHYAGRLIPPNMTLEGAGREMADQIPATIRECVERAKLGMIGRGATSLEDSDLVTAALTMKNHLALLEADTKKATPAENLATSLRQVIIGANGHDTEYQEIIDKATLAGVIAVHKSVQNLRGEVAEAKEASKRAEKRVASAGGAKR